MVFSGFLPDAFIVCLLFCLDFYNRRIPCFPIVQIYRVVSSLIIGTFYNLLDEVRTVKRFKHSFLLTNPVSLNIMTLIADANIMA